eukprot:14578103-Ditylum_brightwellii.AAC.1
MKVFLKKTTSKLGMIGIVLVNDLNGLDDFEDTLTGISEKTKDRNRKNGLSVSILKQLLEQSRSIEHCQAANPYQ